MKLASFITLGFLLFVAALPTHKASAQFGACLPAFCNAAPSVCTQGDAFIARTTGIDAPHQAAYQAFICGLVADGIFGKFDAIYLYAAQNSTVALQSLVSATYDSTLHGSPPFTTDVGFTGIAASTTDYIDTNYNPTTAISAKYTLNDGHLTLWNLSDIAVNCASIGSTDPAQVAYIIPKAPGGPLTYARLNSSPSGGLFTGVLSPLGHWIGSRTGGTQIDGYHNGGNWGGGSRAVVGIPNLNFYTLGTNGAGTAAGCENQITMASFGAGLSAGEATLYYNRSRTYMTTLGIP